MNIPPHLVGDHNAFSDRGGVILCKGNTSFHFYHPFSKVGGEYPSCGMPLLDCIAFTSFPTSSGSVTVGILYMMVLIDVFLYCSIDRKWRSWQFVNYPMFYPNYHNPVYRKGSFYFLDQSGSLGVFKPSEDETIENEPSWNILSRPDGLCKPLYGNYRMRWRTPCRISWKCWEAGSDLQAKWFVKKLGSSRYSQEAHAISKQEIILQYCGIQPWNGK